jgi:hypothetical protein
MALGAGLLGPTSCPSHTARARAFEHALRAIGSYNIYSGSAHDTWHSVISGWQLPTSPGTAEDLLVPRPDRVAIWSAVFNSVNASLDDITTRP